MAKSVKKIQTIHPEGKKSPRIDQGKYDQMHEAIAQVLSEHQEIGFTDALKVIQARLEGKFEGKVDWYYITVKLDMEAKGELMRIPGKGQQMMRKA